MLEYAMMEDTVPSGAAMVRPHREDPGPQWERSTPGGELEQWVPKHPELFTLGYMGDIEYVRAVAHMETDDAEAEPYITPEPVVLEAATMDAVTKTLMVPRPTKKATVSLLAPLPSKKETVSQMVPLPTDQAFGSRVELLPSEKTNVSSTEPRPTKKAMERLPETPGPVVLKAAKMDAATNTPASTRGSSSQEASAAYAMKAQPVRHPASPGESSLPDTPASPREFAKRSRMPPGTNWNAKKAPPPYPPRLGARSEKTTVSSTEPPWTKKAMKRLPVRLSTTTMEPKAKRMPKGRSTSPPCYRPGTYLLGTSVRIF